MTSQTHAKQNNHSQLRNIVNFTREPIIETVITPREGCKLVVRNSKGVGRKIILSMPSKSFRSAILFFSVLWSAQNLFWCL